jgi:cytosine/adenosine deaminase-related metal-dependent hydrolase
VIAERAARPKTGDHPVALGLARCRAAHTSALGEIAAGDLTVEEAERVALGNSAIGGVRFVELMGTTFPRITESLDRARQYLGGSFALGRFRQGLSPHAPYTAATELVEGTVRLAEDHNLPVAMHLAESREELRLMTHGDGPLAEFLIEREVWPPRHLQPRTRPLDYLQRLSLAPRALIVHGNYLNSTELAFLASQRDKMTLVYCPRTHEFFGHEPYPLADALSQGVHVALGTDSCASNPDLSIWLELLYVAQQHPEVPLGTILKMGTVWGAQALFAEDQSLRMGAAANFTVVGLGADAADDPYRALFADSSRPVGSWRDGQPIADDPLDA